MEVIEVINERRCGLDVHKKRVVAYVIISQGQETRTFSTMTQGLLKKLADWTRRWPHDLALLKKPSSGWVRSPD